jgi:hypothetical protein
MGLVEVELAACLTDVFEAVQGETRAPYTAPARPIENLGDEALV